MLAAPILACAFAPPVALKYIYFAVAGCFALQAGCTLLQMLAVVSSEMAGARKCVIRNSDADLERKWPEVAYIIPVNVETEAAFVDDTLMACLNLQYPGLPCS